MSPNLRNIHNGFGIELRACSCVKFLREQIAAKREQIAVKRELDWTPKPQGLMTGSQLRTFLREWPEAERELEGHLECDDPVSAFGVSSR